MKKLGLLPEYACGIFERIEGWFDAMGLRYTRTPDLSRCLKFKDKECRISVQFHFEGRRWNWSGVASYKLKPFLCPLEGPVSSFHLSGSPPALGQSLLGFLPDILKALYENYDVNGYRCIQKLAPGSPNPESLNSG
jgi:hypothetical protein